MLHTDAKPIDLKLTTPFRISRGEQNTASNVIVQINNNEHIGYGEAAPDEYYGENQETALACVALFAGNLGNDPFALEDIMERLDSIIRLNPAAKPPVALPLSALLGKTPTTPLYNLLPP